MNTLRLSIEDLSKQFVLHLRDQQILSVLRGLNLRLEAGQCMVLDGASGTGKSTLLKLIYGNYQASGGRIVLTLPGQTPLELTGASPRQLLQARQSAMGYVSQFLRVIPRTSALEVVAEPLMAAQPRESALEQARHWLSRLQLPERLWSLPPATFSGGEQQRVNIARCLIHPRPVLLLDEPTASLDRTNAEIVASLIEEARQRGSAILGIFHDRIVRDRVATHQLDMNQFRGTS